MADLRESAREAMAGVTDADFLAVGAAYGADFAQKAVRSFGQLGSANWKRCARLTIESGAENRIAARMAATMMVESRGLDVRSRTSDVGPLQVNEKVFPRWAEHWARTKNPQLLASFYRDYVTQADAFVRSELQGTALGNSRLALLLCSAMRYNAGPQTCKKRMAAAKSAALTSGDRARWIGQLTMYGTPEQVRPYPFYVLCALEALRTQPQLLA